jgi:hypothetical protein
MGGRWPKRAAVVMVLASLSYVASLSIIISRVMKVRKKNVPGAGDVSRLEPLPPPTTPRPRRTVRRSVWWPFVVRSGGVWFVLVMVPHCRCRM